MRRAYTIVIFWDSIEGLHLSSSFCTGLRAHYHNVLRQSYGLVPFLFFVCGVQAALPQSFDKTWKAHILPLLCVQGLGHTTMFCGDGINDLAALSAADVGMAIGATDAVIAAELSTRYGSIAGEKSTACHCIALFLIVF